MTALSPQPLGVIVDAMSRGICDLLIYPDGILVVKGTYRGLLLRGAGAGMAAAGGGRMGSALAAGGGSAAGWRAGQSYEGKRLAKLLQQPRPIIVRSNDKNCFIPRESLTHILLRRRWHGGAMTIATSNQPEERTFTWKPTVNDFARVGSLVREAFGQIVEVDEGRRQGMLPHSGD
jgi:hypothetical protein